MTLTDSIMNYRFLFISFAYYGTGFPTYGSLFIPVYSIEGAINNSDYTFRVNASVTNTTSNIIPHYSVFYFLSLSKVKVIGISDQNKYTVFMAL